MLTKRLGAAVLAACLLVALAFGGTVAFAAGDLPGEGTNTLTVSATNNEDLATDIATANVVVDVYKLADAAEDGTYAKYNYTLVSPFSGGELTLPDEVTATASDWEDFALEAAAVITADVTPAQVAADGATSVDLDGDGLFLLVPHGQGVTPAYGESIADSLVAYSDSYQYKFTPSITAAPTKAADADGVISTAADYGEWTRAIAVTLKPEQGPRYGSLKITKTFNDYSGKTRSVNFDIVGTTPAGKEYKNVAQVTCTSDKATSTVVTHIPAGTVVTVTERNDSDDVYEFASDTKVENLKIIADQEVSANKPMAEAKFVNKDNPTSDEYHGIQNTFTLTQTGDGDSDWDWVWTAVPAQEKTE